MGKKEKNLENEQIALPSKEKSQSFLEINTGLNHRRVKENNILQKERTNKKKTFPIGLLKHVSFDWLKTTANLNKTRQCSELELINSISSLDSKFYMSCRRSS
ncbi:hypothetical protein ACFFRR_009416 [Megaselia abdita]